MVSWIHRKFLRVATRACVVAGSENSDTRKWTALPVQMWFRHGVLAIAFSCLVAVACMSPGHVLNPVKEIQKLEFHGLYRRQTLHSASPCQLLGGPTNLKECPWIDALYCVGQQPMLRLRGGRKTTKPDAPSQLRRKKKKKEKRMGQREELRRANHVDYAAKPVMHEGMGKVHPSRLPSDKPISALRQEFKLPIKGKREMAESIGHYPAKKNFMPKSMRRALRKKGSKVEAKVEAKEAKTEKWKSDHPAPTSAESRDRRDVDATPKRKEKRKKQKGKGRDESSQSGDMDVDSIASSEAERYMADADMAGGDDDDDAPDDDNMFGRMAQAQRETRRAKQRSVLSLEGRKARLESFAQHKWPLTAATHPLALPERLASAGFRAEPDGTSKDRAVLEYTGEAFVDWTPTDDPYVVAAEALETVYDEAKGEKNNKGRQIAEQLVYVFTQIGDQSRADFWEEAAARDAQEQTRSDKQAGKKTRAALGGDSDEDDDDEMMDDDENEGDEEHGEQQGDDDQDEQEDDEQVDSEHEHDGEEDGALVVHEGHMASNASMRDQDIESARLAAVLGDASTWRERREQLQAIDKKPSPSWAEFVDSEEEAKEREENRRQKEREKRQRKKERAKERRLQLRQAHEGDATGANITARGGSANQQVEIKSQGKGAGGKGGKATTSNASVSSSSSGSGSSKVSKAQRPISKVERLRNEWLLKLKGIEVRGDLVIVNKSDAVALPTDTCSFDTSTESGKAIEGVTFSKDRRTCVRKDSSSSPMVTWATNLLSGASDKRVRTWALRVVRQTGKWFVGCAERPFHPEYGAAIDITSDGCVLGNHGAVYRTMKSAVVDERMTDKVLRYDELTKLHRESITTACKEQIGAGPGDKGAFAFGTDSIIIMVHDTEAQTLNISVVRARLLLGDHGTAAEGDGVSLGTLERVVPPFCVHGVPKNAVPFVNFDNVGDAASLLAQDDLLQELHWMLYPEPPKVKKHKSRAHGTEDGGAQGQRVHYGKSVWAMKQRQEVARGGVVKPRRRAHADEIITNRINREIQFHKSGRLRVGDGLNGDDLPLHLFNKDLVEDVSDEV